MNSPSSSQYKYFNYSLNGGPLQPFSAISRRSSPHHNQLNLTVAGAPITACDVITLSYTPGSITDDDDHPLAAFSGQAVTNNVPGGCGPTFTSITPNEGPTAGGQAVDIIGTNFVDGGSFGVTIGGNPATSVVRVSSTEITAVTPAHAAGAVDVVITNNDGQYVTETNAYTYYSDALMPLVGDFSGDGIEQAVGLFNKDSSYFFLKWNNTYGEANNTFAYGWVDYSGDLTPVAGHWAGGVTDTIGLYHIPSGTFFLRDTNDAGPADTVVQYGPGGDDFIPIAGDWNGDGYDTIGLYQKSLGAFYLKNTNTGGDADVVVAFGPGGDDYLPVTGDWNGDNTDTIGLYQISTGNFLLRDSNTAGDPDLTFQFGPGGSNDWMPVAADWHMIGHDTIGLYQKSITRFYEKDSNDAGLADRDFPYGWIITP